MLGGVVSWKFVGYGFSFLLDEDEEDDDDNADDVVFIVVGVDFIELGEAIFKLLPSSFFIFRLDKDALPLFIRFEWFIS